MPPSMSGGLSPNTRHVTHPSNLSSIIKRGLSGDEIWFSKDEPIEEYDKGVLIELDLRGIDLSSDDRWKKSDQVYISNESISPKNIKRIYVYFDELQMREDKLAQIIQRDNKSKEEIKSIIEEFNI